MRMEDEISTIRNVSVQELIQGRNQYVGLPIENTTVVQYIDVKIAKAE
jgi:hypothetical protein